VPAFLDGISSQQCPSDPLPWPAVLAAVAAALLQPCCVPLQKPFVTQHFIQLTQLLRRDRGGV